MNLESNNQKNIYGFNDQVLQFVNLYNSKKLPQKILLSGPRGIGKSTLFYHLMNYVLSKDEEYPYEIQNFTINSQNRSFRLIQQNTNPNFTLIDVSSDKKNIDINQIRELIKNMHKTSFNNKPRFILIDNIEYLNINSVNALLKILEEPFENVFFFLIHSRKKILPTLKSRCLEFKIMLSNEESLFVANKLIGSNLDNHINLDLIDYYLTPGKIYNLYKFSKEFNVDLKDMNLNNLISFIVENNYYKKDTSIKYIIFELIECFLVRNINSNLSNYNHFIKKIDNLKKFNLDEESFFLEFKSNMLNG